MVDLVLGQGGSLKAEHGTGRMMAPYVRRQYGDELYEVMREIKRLFDPGGLLNPGVLINDDPEAHLAHLKPAPTVEEEVDRCVECGYCEPVCPSRDLTTTPRQRIVLRREIARARPAGDTALVARAEARLRLRRRRDLRGGRHVPDRLPGADQHRRPGQAAAAPRDRRRRPPTGLDAAAKHWEP